MEEPEDQDGLKDLTDQIVETMRRGPFASGLGRVRICTEDGSCRVAARGRRDGQHF